MRKLGNERVGYLRNGRFARAMCDSDTVSGAVCFGMAVIRQITLIIAGIVVLAMFAAAALLGEPCEIQYPGGWGGFWTVCAKP